MVDSFTESLCCPPEFGLMGKVLDVFTAGVPLGHIRRTIGVALATAVEMKLQGRDDYDMLDCYDSQVRFAVLPEKQLVIVSVTAPDGQQFSLDVHYDELIREHRGVDEAVLTLCLEPELTQSRADLAEVLNQIKK